MALRATIKHENDGRLVVGTQVPRLRTRVRTTNSPDNARRSEISPSDTVRPFLYGGAR